MTQTVEQTRIYSPEEQQAFVNAEDELRQSGLLVDGRTPAAVKNAEIIFNYFETHPNIPVTVANIRAVAKGYVDHLTWISQTAKDYYKQDAAEIALVNKWFEQGSGRLLVGDGEQGRENTLHLLNYCRKLGGLNWQNLNRGIDVLNPLHGFGGKESPLHFKQTQPDRGFVNKTGLVNHAESYQPEQKQEPNRKYINGRLNHAWVHPNAPTAPVQVDPDEGGGWRQVCEALSRDGTWADREELTSVMNRARANGKSWQEVYTVMKQVQKDRHGFRARVR